MYNINVCMYTYAPSSWQIFPIRKAVVKDLSVDQVENKLLTETIHAQHTQHT